MTTSATHTPPGDRLLRRGEVAKLFQVDPRTVTRWADAAKITPTTTPGGERRYAWSEIAPYLPPAAAEPRTG